jgi:hypothetical protein
MQIARHLHTTHITSQSFCKHTACTFSYGRCAAIFLNTPTIQFYLRTSSPYITGDLNSVSPFRRTHTYIALHCGVRNVAKRLLCKQRPFLGNGSVNTFPLLDSRFFINATIDYNNARAVFSMWSVPRCYTQGTKLVDNSLRESVKR